MVPGGLRVQGGLPSGLPARHRTHDAGRAGRRWWNSVPGRAKLEKNVGTCFPQTSCSSDCRHRRDKMKHWAFATKTGLPRARRPGRVLFPYAAATLRRTASWIDARSPCSTPCLFPQLARESTPLFLPESTDLEKRRVWAEGSVFRAGWRHGLDRSSVAGNNLRSEGGQLVMIRPSGEWGSGQRMSLRQDSMGW